jgi:hypothetical protein
LFHSLLTGHSPRPEIGASTAGAVPPADPVFAGFVAAT